MAATVEPSTLMTTGEVARLLRLSPRTVRRLLHSGVLPGVQVGRQWRVATGELDARLLPKNPAGGTRSDRDHRRSHAAR